MTVRGVDVKFTPNWQEAGDWYASLSVLMENNSGKALDKPEIKIQLGQSATATEGTGFTFKQEGDVLVGTMAPHLLPVQDNGSVTFTIGLSFEGDFNGAYPLAYWVDGELAEGGNGGEIDEEAPTQPTGLSTSTVTDTSIALSWNASSDNVGVDHYVVSSASAGGNTEQKASTTSATLTGLSPQTLYTMTVVAVDGAGNKSAPSAELCVTTKDKVIDKEPPTVPANVRVENTTSSSIALKWEPSTDNVAVVGYEIQYAEKGGEAKTLEIASPAISIGGLKAATIYSLSIRAVDSSANKSGFSDVLEVSTLEASSHVVEYAPYVDVTIFATWVPVPTLNTLYIRDALDLGVKKLHLAFLCYDKNTDSMIWGNNSFPLKAIDEIVAMINDSGAEAIFALGGASGLDPSVHMSVDQLTQLYVDIAQEYSVRHIDLDFETSGLYDYNKAFPAALAAQKQIPDLHFSLTLPVMPTGLVAEGLAMINAAKEVGLEVSVQIMAMDYGQSNADMGQAAVDAALSTKKQLAEIYPEKSDAELFALIGVTPMLGLNDTAPETFFLSNIPTLTDFAKANGLALIGAWDLNRDFPLGPDSHNNDHTDVATCAMEPNQTQEYEFLKTFVRELSQ